MKQRHKQKNADDDSIKATFINSATFLNEPYLLGISLIVRISSVFLVQTYFVPDEYWQSSEVAHRHVFRYGYLTWEWHEKIRSYLHPFIFEIYYLLLKLAHLDYSHLVIYGPHLIQAILTAYSDVSVYFLSLKIFNSKETALMSFLLQQCSWFLYYTGSRTLSNTTEMCLTSIALSYFKISKDSTGLYNTNRQNLFLVLLFGGASCIIRPTALLIWINVILFGILSKRYHIKELSLTVCKVLPIMLFLSFGVDYYFYKTLVFVHWNFVKFNLVENFSVFYGVHPIYWYFTQGLPVVMYTHLLFMAVGVKFTKSRFLFYVGLFYIGIHR